MLQTVGPLTDMYRRALPSFMTLPHDGKLLKNNKDMIFGTLSIVRDSNEGYLQETGVLSWGQIGRQVLTAGFKGAR
jgi:hypothetical protein